MTGDESREGPFLAKVDLQALQAAGFIGTWATDVTAGLSVLDHGAAALLAGDAGLAGKPLPLERALGRIHEDDRGWMFDRVATMRRLGGRYSAEFRIRTPDGRIRRILDRGVTEPDARGRMWGRGAFLDTTEGHTGRFRPSDPETLPQAVARPLDVAARHCIAAREAIDRTGDPVLRLLVDALLAELGRALARGRFT